MSLTTLITGAVGIWKPRPSSEPQTGSAFPDVSQAAPDTRRLIRDRRYCRVLSKSNKLPFDDVSLTCAWQALEHEMALVPGGELCIHGDIVIGTQSGFEIAQSEADLINVETLYLDRDCVSNADYAKFVQSGGYSDPQYWPETVLPNVLQFTDSTGQPGPKFWINGAPAAEKLDHPVTGICWYEASAYATWVGKRLPSSEEWQRAGTWSKGHAGDLHQQKYPWGDSFDPRKANVWASGIGDTVSVASLNTGETPNGVRHLIGNVWEWIDGQFFPEAESNVAVLLDQTMAEIRGGAFDTYFHSQATCQFKTGQPLLFRGANVGFRCCISEDAVSVPEVSSSPVSDQDQP